MDNLKRILFSNMGSLLAMISAVFIAIYGSMVKEITSDLRFGILLAIKNFFQVLFSFIFILVTKSKFFPTERPEMKMLALRSITSSIVAVAAAISYACLPIFDAFSFFYSGCLIFGVVIGIFYFKERIGVYKMFIIILLFIGILFVSQPSFIFGNGAKIDIKYAIGMGAVVISGVSQTVCSMSVKMMKETHTHLIILYSGVCGMIFATICYPIRNSENVLPNRHQIILIMFLVAVYIFYLFTEINALKRIEFIKFQIFSLLDLPVTFLIDYFWFNTELNVFRWAGFTCIVVALLGSAVYEYFTQPSEEFEEIAGNNNFDSTVISE